MRLPLLGSAVGLVDIMVASNALCCPAFACSKSKLLVIGPVLVQRNCDTNVGNIALKCGTDSCEDVGGDVPVTSELGDGRW